jgi:pyruvyltransferase
MIRARWYNEDNNWGDKLNPILIQHISGQKVIYTKKAGHFKYIVVGSILHYADDKSEVWGAGLISSNHKPRGNPKIHAVRGPLTRKRLLELGHDCPEIYGDPALLYPRYYNPKIEKKYELGIIPHYKDKENSWVRNKKGAKVIDIQGPLNKVVDEVCSCEAIISSSLHGIIMADAYGIPGYWVKLSDKLVGGDFKFRDYCMSVGREPIALILTNTNIEEQFFDYKINIDLGKLMNACPFKNQENQKGYQFCL